MNNINKNVENLEKIFKVENVNEFFVLLRRKRKWILNTCGHPVARVTQGEPTERDLKIVVPDAILGPFETRKEAEKILENEIEQMKQKDPSRFASLDEMHKMIIPHPDDFPEVKK